MKYFIVSMCELFARVQLLVVYINLRNRMLQWGTVQRYRSCRRHKLQATLWHHHSLVWLSRYIIKHWLTHHNFTTFMCRLSINLWASTSWNPQGLSRPVMGLLYIFLSMVQSVTSEADGTEPVGSSVSDNQGCAHTELGSGHRQFWATVFDTSQEMPGRLLELDKKKRFDPLPIQFTIN
jgi:hypothetical protein